MTQMVKVKHRTKVPVQRGGLRYGTLDVRHSVGSEHGVEIMPVHELRRNALRCNPHSDVAVQRAIGREEKDPASGQDQNVGERRLQRPVRRGQQLRQFRADIVFVSAQRK